ncbi:hypothetical protein ACFY4C_10765 [Actinomadura viridis]|uniref:hypothetical protein n=1 Tax=Actinomadura viridis TaxID=58110 RepID=UPI0036889DEE
MKKFDTADWPSAHSGPPWPPEPPTWEIERAVAQRLRRQYGAVVWYGRRTRRWWAYTGGRLVEGDFPAHLEAGIIQARGWWP